MGTEVMSSEVFGTNVIALPQPSNFCKFDLFQILIVNWLKLPRRDFVQKQMPVGFLKTSA